MQHIRRVQAAEEGQDTRAGQVIVPVVTVKAIGVNAVRAPWWQHSESHPRRDRLICSHD